MKKLRTILAACVVALAWPVPSHAAPDDYLRNYLNTPQETLAAVKKLMRSNSRLREYSYITTCIVPGGQENPCDVSYALVIEVMQPYLREVMQRASDEGAIFLEPNAPLPPADEMMDIAAYRDRKRQAGNADLYRDVVREFITATLQTRAYLQPVSGLSFQQYPRGFLTQTMYRRLAEMVALAEVLCRRGGGGPRCDPARILSEFYGN